MRVTVSGRAPCDLRAALAHAGLPADAGVALAFVGEDEVRALNARYRGIDRVTDVLSFGQQLPAGVSGAAAAPHLRRAVDGSLELGDIVISPGVARRQARRRGWSLVAEVAFLAAHGGLHLLGYEDDTPSSYREIRRRGVEALARARRPARGRNPN